MVRFSPQELEPQLLLRASIVVAVLTIALKTLAWWITDSVGLLSDAMESLVNLASAVFALVMVTIARRPADADHPYGHHKAEYFSSGFEGLLIIEADGRIPGSVHVPRGMLEFRADPTSAPGLVLIFTVGADRSGP